MDDSVVANTSSGLKKIKEGGGADEPEVGGVGGEPKGVGEPEGRGVAEPEGRGGGEPEGRGGGEPEKPETKKETKLHNGNIFLQMFKSAKDTLKKSRDTLRKLEDTVSQNTLSRDEDKSKGESKETEDRINVYENLRKYHLVKSKEKGKSEKERKKSEEERKKSERKRQEVIADRVNKINKKLEKLCEERKNIRVSKESDKEKKLKVINRHIQHLSEEEHHIKTTHKKDKYDKENETFWERFHRIGSSETTAVFVLFCAVTVFIFTLTAFYASDDPTYKNQSLNVKNIIKANLYTGIIYFAIFIGLLSFSFGKDKDYAEKLASLVLLTGAIFVGLFFSFLNSEGKLKDLTKTESLTVSIATAVTFLFIFFAIYYELFEKGNGKVDNDLKKGYLFISLTLFWIMGSMMTYLTFGSEYGEDKALKLLFPLSTGLFFAGILGTIGLILSYFKSVDDSISVTLNTVLNLVEWFRFKIIIMACFILSIYYTYLLYRANQTEKDPNSKFKIKKDAGLVDTVERSFYAGVGFISFFLLILGICFGGTLKERLFATFLILFITFVGGLTLWLDGEKKIRNLDKSEENVLKATEVIFCVLAVIAIWYVLFKAKTSIDETLTTLARIIVNFGSVIFFFYSFSLICAVYGKFNFKRELDIFPNKNESLSIELFTGICIGILAIIVSIAIIV